MTALVTLWEFSLLLCAIALAAVCALLFARIVATIRRRRGDEMRKRLFPAMMRGEMLEQRETRLSRRTAASLTLELSEFVRGSDRDSLLAVAEAAHATRDLFRRLGSHDPQQRLVAAEALALFPDHSEEVARVIFSDPNPDVRLGAALALAQEGRAPSPRDLVLSLGIGDREPSRLAASLLRDLAQSDPEAVAALLYDEEVPDRAKFAATDALAESAAVDLKALVGWMADAAGGDAALHPRIVRALGRIGHPSGHPTILAALSSENWQVRAAGAEAAGRAALSAAIPDLVRLLGDGEWWVRLRAGAALARLGAAGHQALRDAARSGDPVTGTAASATMAERGIA